MPALRAIENIPTRFVPQGEIHVEVGSSPDGEAVEYFIIDPPVSLPFADQKTHKIKPRHNHEKHKIAATDSLVRESSDADPYKFTNHLISWVWQHEYKNVADLIETIRRFGITRRVSLENLQEMSKESLLVLVHSKGFIENWRKYGPLMRPCPKSVKECGRVPESHILWGEGSTATSTMCAGYWWCDIESGRRMDKSIALKDSLVYRDFVPSDKEAEDGFSVWSYVGFSAPDSVEPKYSPAMVLRLPISRILVSNTLLPSVAEACEKLGLPVEVV